MSATNVSSTSMRFRSLRVLTLLPIYLLYVSSVTSAQGTRKVLLNDETDAFIHQVLTDFNSPGGAAVAVVRMDDQGAWSVETKGYGIATANGSKVTENTLFPVGSNSKLFTVFATGLLIHNETLTPRLSWTSKFASIVPGWDLQDPVAAKQATITDAMSHRTGLPRHDASYKWSDDIFSIIKKLKYQRPSAEFRDVFQYNNNMYTLLSSLQPILLPSKTPFARYVKEHIFDPLGLSSTTYSYDTAKANGHLADGMTKQGVNVSENPLGNGTVRALPFWSTIGGEDGNIMSGAGGVISSAVDMAVWLQTLLLEGVKPGTNESIIPADVVQKAAAGITVVSGESGLPELSPTVYGGGQVRGTYRGHEIIEHDGSVPGFNAIVSRLPFDNLGIAVLTNDDLFGSVIHEVIKFRLMDDALGLERVDWSARYKGEVSIPLPPASPRPANASMPSVNFTSVAGTYNNLGYGSFELCLVSPNNAAASGSCKALASNVSTILPGAVDPSGKIPTFLAGWNSPAASHLRLTHWNGNTFNVSGLTSYATGNTSEPYWTAGAHMDTSTGVYAELVVDHHRIGLAFNGIWGAGVGVQSPKGQTMRERAEVWFDRA